MWHKHCERWSTQHAERVKQARICKTTLEEFEPSTGFLVADIHRLLATPL